LAGDDESAIHTLGSYQSRYPKGKQNEKASQSIVQALYRKGDFSGVIATITRDNGALNSDPDLGLIVSESYRKAGQPAKAREVLMNMLPRLSGQKTGVLTSAYTALGNLYYGDGAYQEAWEAYQKGLQSAPSMEDQEFIQLMMGRSFSKMGQKSRAAEIFSELMKSPSETVKMVAEGWGKELPDETF
jgi:TolA-binding protein